MAEPEHLSWEAPPFIVYQRGKYWRLLILSAAAVLAGVFILSKFYITAAVMIIGALAIIIQVAEKAHPMRVTLTQTGVRFGRHTYLYQNLKRFWILFLEQPVLFVESKGAYTLPHSVVIADYQPAEVRDFLRHYLEEAKDEVDTEFLQINRLIGFS